MPKISVIVPVYNVEKYIEKCLNSLINQTLEEIEIIIVNDGTKDNSMKIVKRFQERYPKKIVCLEKRKWRIVRCKKFCYSICKRRIYSIFRFR